MIEKNSKIKDFDVLPLSIKEFLFNAIKEDEGSGDVTSISLISPYEEAAAHIIAKEELVLAGMPFVKEVFRLIDGTLKLDIYFEEGDIVKKSEIIALARGSARSLLLAERISLNLLQRISGIATFTRAFIERLKGLAVNVADTRKTTPCLRYMEKYGVRVGGGINHRFGLYDGILIKDNHIKIVGSITRAIELAKKAHHLLKIEIEVKNLKEFEEALMAGADVIMLDNMRLEDIRQAVNLRDELVKKINREVLLEVSGGVTLENIRSFAETGVDIVSVGALTHSAKAVDISMKIL
ncbi:MAG: carboxylating nicotinate-nucleotide diphosphorylase [Thermodesulfovibrionales bacterium]|nr:carboxylating nicotinate-nucleotide diphosphorylase [Thermodesulfovibrionales bacterium]